MQLTYYVLLEILSSSSDRRGQILGTLGDYIDMNDFLSDAADETRMIFNENALKGVKEFVDSQDEPELYKVYVVAIEESESIFALGNQDLEDFSDLIEIYPDMDESRVDSITLDFKRSVDQRESGFESNRDQIKFEKAAQIVENFIDDAILDDEHEDSSLEKDLVAKRLPTKEQLLEILSTNLDIDDDSQIGEVVISQSESSLAIMHALMSDDLAEIEEIDVDRINRSILNKIKQSDQSDKYLRSHEVLQSFLQEVNAKKEEIESQYEKDMQAYIDQMIEQLKEEYRSKVPDLTEQNLAEYYTSVNEQFEEIQSKVDQTGKELDKEIMKIFTSADRSKAMKALKKFLALKEQIRDSALKSIFKIHQAEESKMLERSEALRIEQERLEQKRLEQERLEQERLEQERLERERLEHERLERERLERERLEQERLEQERLEQERIEQERLRLESLEKETDSQDLDQLFVEEKNSNKEVLGSEDVKLTDDAEVDSNDLKDISDKDNLDEDSSDMQMQEVAKVDLSDIVEDEDVDFEASDSESKKKKTKMSLPMKIGLGVAAAFVTIALTVGGIAMMNKSHKNQQSQTRTTKSSQKIDDTVFNVGDVLTITGENGESLDVTITEFKKDGSAVAEDDNKDKWLITKDQMNQYAKSHPDQFKNKKKSKDQDKSKNSSDEKNSENSTSDSQKESSNQTESSSTESSSTPSEVPNTNK